MDKNHIRIKLRESLEQLTTEENGQPTEKPIKGKGKQFKKGYPEIQRSLDNTMLKKSQVMAAAGQGDPNDAGDRRAFNAKLDREENEDGSVRQFSDKELAAVAKVVSNPKSYLTKKVITPSNK